jgi:hypothetical protein
MLCVPVALPDACQEAVEVGAGELPVEGPGGRVVVLFGGEDLGGDLIEVLEVVEVVGVRSLRWMTTKGINRLWEKYAFMSDSDSGYRVSRLRWAWMLAMTCECRATSVCQPRAASSRRAVRSASSAWSCGMNSGAVT